MANWGTMVFWPKMRRLYKASTCTSVRDCNSCACSSLPVSWRLINRNLIVLVCIIQLVALSTKLWMALPAKPASKGACVRHFRNRVKSTPNCVEQSTDQTFMYIMQRSHAPYSRIVSSPKAFTFGSFLSAYLFFAFSLSCIIICWNSHYVVGTRHNLKFFPLERRMYLAEWVRQIFQVRWMRKGKRHGIHWVQSGISQSVRAHSPTY